MRKTMMALGAFVAIGSSGCGGFLQGHSLPWDEGHVAVIADARGMRAFGDAMNGLITNGKASPDVDTPYYANRRLEDAEITKRELVRKAEPPQGLWQKLWGQPVAAQQQQEVAK